MQNHLLRLGQAQVAVLEHLDKVIQEADQPGAEGQKQYEQPGLHLGQAQNLRQLGVEHSPHNAQGCQDAQDKAETAHGGGAVFLVVPGGAFLPDGLAEVQPVQHRDQNFTGYRRDDKAADGRRRQQRRNLLHAVIPPNSGGSFPLRQFLVEILQQLLQAHGVAGLCQHRVTGAHELP